MSHMPSTSAVDARAPRTIAWGTTIAGTIALGLAVLIGLSEIVGLSIPFSTAGPGAVIAVGVLILLAGLAAVIRSGRSATTAPRAISPQTSTPHVTAPQVSAPRTEPTAAISVDDAGPPPGRPVTAPDDGPAQSSH